MSRRYTGRGERQVAELALEWASEHGSTGARLTTCSHGDGKAWLFQTAVDAQTLAYAPCKSALLGAGKHFSR